MLTPEQIQAAADRIVAALQPKKIILFGSYARGDATEHSDLDLMVVGSQKEKRNLKAIAVGMRALAYLPINTDIVVYSDDEFAERSHWCSQPAYWAVHEGRVLYDR